MMKIGTLERWIWNSAQLGQLIAVEHRESPREKDVCVSRRIGDLLQGGLCLRIWPSLHPSRRFVSLEIRPVPNESRTAWLHRITGLLHELRKAGATVVRADEISPLIISVSDLAKAFSVLSA
jgi:hypothetical protein